MMPLMPLMPLLTLLVGGCLSGQIGMDETSMVVLSSGASSGEVSGDQSSSIGGIMTTTEDPEHTSVDSQSEAGTDSDTSGTSTTGIPAMCGDGVVQVEDGEACDDGDANADDAACTSHCLKATCGDELVQSGVEACDDGNNDGSYGGCEAGCTAKAAHCGDGTVQGPEKCDGGPVNSGCLPATCVYAKSCKQIKDAHGDAAKDGVYTIAPLNANVAVFCDMDADGGGYTFLKIAEPAPAGAKAAEMACAKYGMRLLVPRSPAHLDAASLVAQSELPTPIGAGPKSSLDYLQIFGIYPDVAGQSCAGQPLNNEKCPEWTAFGDVFWVTDEAPDATEPGIKNCLGCSLAYYWNLNGTLIGYESFLGNNEGHKSNLFMCEVPDKLPAM